MLKETDLYDSCKNWLTEKGCEVKSEVNDVDVLGRFENECLIAIEMKLNLNLEVINQAVQRQKLVDYVYIATVHNSSTIHNKRSRSTIDTLKRLHIGWITVDFKAKPPKVSTIVEAKEFDLSMSRKRKTNEKERLIREFNNRSIDLNRGGSTRKKLMTAYREEALKIAYALSQFETASVKTLKSKGTHEKKTSAILNSNYYHWFTKVERGVYALSDSGRNALVEYHEMIPYISQKIDGGVHEPL